MIFDLHIELDNDAMRTYNHLAKALEKTAEKLRDYEKPTPGETGRIMDVNGNSVGHWRLVSTDPGNGDNVL